MSFPDWKLFVACVIRTLGLNIRAIEKNSRSERERIFEEDECIVQINDTELIDKSFAQWVSDSFIRHTFIVVMWITNRPPALFLSTSFSSFIIRLLCCFMRLFSVLVARSVQTQSFQTFCPPCYLSLYPSSLIFLTFLQSFSAITLTQQKRMVFSCHECGIALLSGIRGIGQPSKERQIKRSGTIRGRVREMAMRVKGFEVEKKKDFNQASQFYISCGVLNWTPKNVTHLTQHELIHFAFSIVGH